MGLEFPLRSEAFLTVGGTRWYSALQENALYCEDLQTGDIRFVARFPTMDSFRLHGSILCVDDVLYFAPMKAEGLDVYDIKEKKMTRIPIPREKGGGALRLPSYPSDRRLPLFCGRVQAVSRVPL